MAGFLTYFLYNNLYRPITETEVIVTLRTQYAVESVSFQAYQSLERTLKEKQERPRTDWASFRNTFTP